MKGLFLSNQKARGPLFDYQSDSQLIDQDGNQRSRERGLFYPPCTGSSGIFGRVFIKLNGGASTETQLHKERMNFTCTAYLHRLQLIWGIIVDVHDPFG